MLALELDARGDLGRTALHCAVAPGHTGIARALIDAGADLGLSVGGPSLIHLAASSADETMISLVLENNIDVDQRSETGSTPLLQATFQGNLAVVRLLIQKGASLEARTNEGGTPALLGGHDRCR